MSAAFPPRSLGAPSSRLIARRENSAAALRSLAGSAGGPARAALPALPRAQSLLGPGVSRHLILSEAVGNFERRL